MLIRVLNDKVEVEGYVNAVERKSKPLMSRLGEFVERICKGAFARALERNDDIRLLLNHDWEKDLGGTKDGTLVLNEDSIGLKARATITDQDVIEKARNGQLVGWSFGFTDREVDNHEENGMPTRDVKDLNLFEVSLLDKTKTPAYDGTLVAVRAADEMPYFNGAAMIDEMEIRDDAPKPEPIQEIPANPAAIDYSKYEKMIEEMKGVNE